MRFFVRGHERRKCELDEEIRMHFEMAVKDRIARGESREQAERAARLEFGSVDNVKEDARAVWGGMWAEYLGRDIRFALRGLRRRPALALIIALTLSLGIGANVAIFSLAEQILLRPLPVPEPNRLVNLSDPGAKTVGQMDPEVPLPPRAAADGSGGPESVFSYPMFRDLEREQESFVGVAAHRYFQPSLSTGERPQIETGALVSGSYFAVLGLQPALGRLFGPQDDRIDGQAEAVVLSYAYWQSEFEGDVNVLGRTLFVNDRPLTIVGVAPQGFHGTSTGQFLRATVFVPITMSLSSGGAPTLMAADQPPNHERRDLYWTHLFARLKPGITREQAAAQMNAVFTSILQDTEAPLLTNVNERQRETFRTRPLVLEPGARGQTNAQTLALMRNALLLLLAVGSVVLLLCCANVAALMLVRSSERTGEMAVRASMGASRGRLASLLLAESLVLSLPAAFVSLPVAWLIPRVLGRVPGLPLDASGILETVSDVSVNAAAVLVAIGVAVASALVVGLFPVRSLERTEPGQTLQASGARHTVSRGVARFRAVLATSQVALSMTLLVLAGVLVQSFANATRLELGVDLGSVVMTTVEFGLGTGQRIDDASRVRIAESLNSIPGVTTVASSVDPLLGIGASGFSTSMTVEGLETDPQPVSIALVSPNFFQVFGINLLAGRDFTDQDPFETIVVSQKVAERFGLSPNALVGRTINYGFGPTEIIGVVTEAILGGANSEVTLQMYQPVSSSRDMTFYVRSSQSTDGLMSTIRETLNGVDQGMQISNLRTMAEQFQENIALERFIAGVSTAFAVFATGLAALGLYGVLAYSVAQRSREIGLRVALGAPTGRIRGMVIRQVAAMAIVGVVLGALAASFLGHAADEVLFGVEAGDPLSLFVAAAVLVLVTLGAAYFPARRASRVDPMAALRYE